MPHTHAYHRPRIEVNIVKDSHSRGSNTTASSEHKKQSSKTRREETSSSDSDSESGYSSRTETKNHSEALTPSKRAEKQVPTVEKAETEPWTSEEQSTSGREDTKEKMCTRSEEELSIYSDEESSKHNWSEEDDWSAKSEYDEDGVDKHDLRRQIEEQDAQLSHQPWAFHHQRRHSMHSWELIPPKYDRSPVGHLKDRDSKHGYVYVEGVQREHEHEHPTFSHHLHRRHSLHNLELALSRRKVEDKILEKAKMEGHAYIDAVISRKEHEILEKAKAADRTYINSLLSSTKPPSIPSISAIATLSRPSIPIPRDLTNYWCYQALNPAWGMQWYPLSKTGTELWYCGQVVLFDVKYHVDGYFWCNFGVGYEGGWWLVERTPDT